ncbi:MAG: phosphoribosyltransferase-like protein, partial [Luteibacter jiangsuensis]
LSLSDGMQKGPQAATAEEIEAVLPGAYFTPVEGEKPNPTDSGFFLCRRARQILKVPEDRIVNRDAALEKAYQGAAIVFLDDFVGSGDQFISTWERVTNGRSFKFAQKATSFIPIYVSMVCLEKGISRIHQEAPMVALSTAHILEERSTLNGVMSISADVQARLEDFLRKYSPRLKPNEPYIANNPSYKVKGYKNGGLMLAFEHSVPDATLPIFWSSGDVNWVPLLERA